MITDEKDREIAEDIRAIMVAMGKTLSTAESCTSGRIASSLTSVSGASDYFQGGMVVYQNELKTRFLGVSPETIEEHDVVSKEVVTQMVIGCCQLFHTDYAIASTGYTGGGNERVPGGTVWIAWGSQDNVHTACITEDRGREANTGNAAFQAIRRFWEEIGPLRP